MGHNAKNGNGGKGKAHPPVHSVRSGAVKAAVWENDTQHGVMHNVMVSRSYKDDQGNWQGSGSFGADDLLPLAKALDAAHSWIHKQRQARHGDRQED